MDLHWKQQQCFSLWPAQTLPSECFNGTLSVRELRLDGNALRTMPARPFAGMAVVRLSLSANRLEALPAHAFQVAMQNPILFIFYFFLCENLKMGSNLCWSISIFTRDFSLYSESDTCNFPSRKWEILIEIFFFRKLL